MLSEAKHLVLGTDGFFLTGTRFFVAPLFKMTSANSLP